MPFNSLSFVLGFPLFCLVYFLAPPRFQLTLLLAASLGACATAGITSLTWLLLMTVAGYLFARRIARAPSPRVLLLAVSCVVAPLITLKYTNFAIEILQTALGELGLDHQFAKVSFPQPVGLSFYTFVVVGYLVDVHLERCPGESRLTRFTLFTGFFPKLISGPVESAGGFLPQLEKPKGFDYERITDGARIMAWGYFKKVVVADRLGLLVSPVFGKAADFRGLTIVIACVLYMFQIYYDFWGYSDIAVGAARVLGFDLTWNFDRPYAARSVSDYWRRWHISLTRWFFGYIFTPLAATFRSWRMLGVVLSLMVTFVVSGLWHGAQWTFVLFGVFHGTALSLEYATTKWRKTLRRRVPARLYAVCAWVATFTFLACVDVIFRAPTIGDAFDILARGFHGILPDLVFLAHHRASAVAIKTLLMGFGLLNIELLIAVSGIAVVELVSFSGRKEPVRVRLARQPTWVRWPVYYAVASAVLFLGMHNVTTAFLYVQF
jgi:D-alanyl-lipoteichoic acid acyltransferase DltB (MBOAT superfamily)